MAVVEAGSMGKAAQRLHTSQPAISRTISDLEHALGVPSPQGIAPTEYGRALIKRGLAVFDELRQSIKDIEFLADPTAGELRIGCNPILAPTFVSVVVNRLSRRCPRLTFHPWLLRRRHSTTN
jgi:DNA-binding transcriptional LysR family regulator